MLADLLEALLRDSPAAGDVLQERHHVLGGLGPAEGEQQQSVVRGSRAGRVGRGAG